MNTTDRTYTIKEVDEAIERITNDPNTWEDEGEGEDSTMNALKGLVGVIDLYGVGWSCKTPSITRALMGARRGIGDVE